MAKVDKSMIKNAVNNWIDHDDDNARRLAKAFKKGKEKSLLRLIEEALVAIYGIGEKIIGKVFDSLSELWDWAQSKFA